MTDRWFDRLGTPGRLRPGWPRREGLGRGACISAVRRHGTRRRDGPDRGLATSPLQEVPLGDPFRIGVVDPADRRRVARVVSSPGAVATSGTAERPAPLQTEVGRGQIWAASATVTGPSLATADALATALAVAGADGLGFVERAGYGGLVVRGDGRRVATTAFAFRRGMSAQRHRRAFPTKAPSHDAVGRVRVTRARHRPTCLGRRRTSAGWWRRASARHPSAARAGRCGDRVRDRAWSLAAPISEKRCSPALLPTRSSSPEAWTAPGTRTRHLPAVHEAGGLVSVGALALPTHDAAGATFGGLIILRQQQHDREDGQRSWGATGRCRPRRSLAGRRRGRRCWRCRAERRRLQRFDVRSKACWRPRTVGHSVRRLVTPVRYPAVRGRGPIASTSSVARTRRAAP